MSWVGFGQTSQRGLEEGSAEAVGPEKRRKVPDSIALQVALRQLRELLTPPGEPLVKLELDHDPALARRDWDRQTRHHIPHQHHPDALIYRVKSDHDRKTNGRPSTTLGSDKHEIAKTQRLEERRADREAADFRKRLLHPGDPEEPRQERAKPKYRWPSRPFPKNQKNR